MPKVAVLGGGVNGLSTAINIQTSLPGIDIDVIASNFHDSTTSIGAGGIFIPTYKNILAPKDRLRLVN